VAIIIRRRMEEKGTHGGKTGPPNDQRIKKTHARRQNSSGRCVAVRGKVHGKSEKNHLEEVGSATKGSARDED